MRHGFIKKTRKTPAEDIENREAKDERGSRVKKRNHNIGSSLDDFLKEEGFLQETRTIALKETLAWQIHQAMKKEKINKDEMARRMHTSRAALDRLLDPQTVSVTLQTLCKVARAIGRIFGSSWFKRYKMTWTIKGGLKKQ